MRAADFDYNLPPELIAQTPAPARDESRLLVLRRAENQITHRHFRDLPEFFSAGDLLVLNDSRVIPARLRARNSRTNGLFEILLLEENAPNDWRAMMRPGKRAPVGACLQILDKNREPSAFTVTVREINAEGHRRLEFSGAENILTALGALGEVPLPPYIARAGEQTADRERYQTVYARADGSVAAPTAGLHFTPGLLQEIRARGARVCFVTLHVGPGTFAPVKAERLEEHVMHAERFVLSEETAKALRETKEAGARIVAAGTTTLRVLESANQPGLGRTRLFIHPPRDFKTVDALITNFHLPRSTLLMLAAAFAAPGTTRGREMILRAYEEAIARRYRFFSYGDAMLLL
ncbi:MAG TPA: tRNA preQ1(34) S-adenosylmethionine ribosyltransferase-isomerase QueA [Verrucomicrobiae bacterium]|jgi:S-adenosylmethionine:tRNA ribosyltransferase-isomerase